jgi:CheY-like chemotaxis protein
MTGTTVAIVEDEVLLALELEDLCRDFGCAVLGVASSGAAAVAQFADAAFDVLITDMELGNTLDGVDVVEILRKDHPSLDVVFVTGTRAPEKLARIRAVSPRKVLRKPIDSRELRRALSAV